MAPLLEALGGFKFYISRLQGDSRHNTLELYRLFKQPAKGNVAFWDECGEGGGGSGGVPTFHKELPLLNGLLRNKLPQHMYVGESLKLCINPLEFSFLPQVPIKKKAPQKRCKENLTKYCLKRAG